MTQAQTESSKKPVPRRLWWVLPLVVLLALIAVIYLLSHLSAADSEMYPTTKLDQAVVAGRLC